MFDLHIYRTTAELPLHFYYQAQAFVRIFWVDGEDYNIDLGLQYQELHIVLAKDKSLVAYASVSVQDVQLAGVAYRCYGLSGVMTFPAFRKFGYGGQVIDTALNLIREDTSADIALLWTDPQNVHFYVEHGWIAMPDMTTLMGDPTHPTVFDDELALMLFLSERAQRQRAAFERGQIYIGEENW